MGLRVSSLSFAGQVGPATWPSREGPRHWVQVAAAGVSAAMSAGEWVPSNPTERRRLSFENGNGRVGDIEQSLRAKSRFGCRTLSDEARDEWSGGLDPQSTVLMNTKGWSLRARLGGRGNPAEIPDGSPRRFAPRDDKEGSLPLPPHGSVVVPARAGAILIY